MSKEIDDAAEQDKEIERIAYQLYIELEAATKLNGNLSSDAEGIKIVQDWLRMVLRSYGSKEYVRGFEIGMDRKFQEDRAQKAYERGRKEMREEAIAALQKTTAYGDGQIAYKHQMIDLIQSLK